ncbi:amidohydrolase [Tsukamurella pseudospumae]|uniref:Amidohydrolase n=1 Tax=Tsukamurella pseudospumae TaxID=239498 RepID=A0A137ZKG4_9ACTN|nr:amidohydrolase [Tsukamurella pseudospumae]KXO98692.1 amidohydrolase [Tsukamurella pseudospumae]
MIHYRNGRVVTVDPENPHAQSLVVDGARLAYVGSDDGAAAFAPDAEVVDLDGALVLPGFVDAHTHLVEMGTALSSLDLLDVRDAADLQDRLRTFAAERGDAERLIGGRWLLGPLAGRAPDRHLLDAAVPDRPVYLHSNDMHSMWVNTAALAELGVDAETPDPVGGTIVRDDAGAATGLLLEMAALGLASDFLAARVTDGDRDAALRTAIDAYLRTGVTGAVDMAMRAEDLAALERTAAAGTLGMRIAAHWLIVPTGDTEQDLAQVREAVAQAERLQGGPIRIAGIKIMVDGVIDSCTAAMRAPFADGTRPGAIWPLAELEPVVRAADTAGLQVAMHAIGDAASDIALTAVERAIAANGPRDRRHRLEHLEVVGEDSIARLAALGVVASMQPVHADPAIQETWRASLGDHRCERGYPWPEITAAGARLAFGSDAPTAPHPPLPNLFIASTRHSAIDPSLPPNLPHYALPLAQALAHATGDSAYACRWEDETGVLAAGLAADFVVLDTDPFTEGPDSLLTAQVRRTVAGGVTRWSAE